MKPFDLEAALRGDPVVTRDGRPVTGLHKHEGVKEGCECLTGVFDELVKTWHQDGKFTNGDDHLNDLCMAPKKVMLWVNVYPSSLPSTKYDIGPPHRTADDADKQAEHHRIACVPIEFEV